MGSAQKVVRRVQWVAVLAVAVVVGAGCAPPTTPPPAPPSGAFEVSGEHLGRWDVGESVDVPLVAAEAGHPAAFTITDGALPVGVTLAGGRLVGVPAYDGLWMVKVRADGPSGSVSGDLFGYVVGPSTADPGPVVEVNPARAEFTVEGSTELSPAPRSYWVYEPGQTEPIPAPTVSGRASEPHDPARDPGPFTTQFGALVAGRLVREGATPCAMELVTLAGRHVADLAVDDTAAHCTWAFSRDGSTVLTRTSDAEARGSAHFDFWDARDAQHLRSITVPATNTTRVQYSLAEDGSYITAQETDADTGELLSGVLDVYGVDPARDRSFDLGDSGRLCTASWMPRTASIPLLCETPGLGSQVGVVDPDGGFVWVSAPMLFAGGTTISVDGSQVMYLAIESYDTGAEIRVAEVGSNGSGVRVMAVPTQFGGIAGFLPW